MSRLIFSLLPRTTDGGEFLSPRPQELGQFQFMRMRPSRVRWSCYKRRSTEYRTKGRGAKSRALPASIVATASYITTAQDVNEATGREKQLKGWIRAKKIALIEAKNPRWEDLAELGLADGVCRGSDQRQMRELLDTPLPGMHAWGPSTAFLSASRTETPLR
jgi:predicted GIY-YIG superfamily endonuclease